MRHVAALLALCLTIAWGATLAQDGAAVESGMPSSTVSVVAGDEPGTVTIRMTLTDSLASRVFSQPVVVIGKGEPARLVMGYHGAIVEVLLQADAEGRTVDYEARFVRDGKVEQSQRSTLAVMPRT